MKSQLASGIDSQILFVLPELPSIIRYYDEFTDELRSIQNPKSEDVWTISIYGSSQYFDFTVFHEQFRPLIKYWCSYQLQTYSIGTVSTRIGNLQRTPDADMYLLVLSSSTNVRLNWQSLLAKGYSASVMDSLKSILHLFCKFNLAGWSQDYSEFLSTLPLPTFDKYASVRTGDVFLSVDEEAVLVAHFDALSQKIQNKTEVVTDTDLRDAAILVCSFQFGLRPMQIGMLQMRDVRIWNDIDGTLPSVHLMFKMVKQHSRTTALPLTRKIKHDWSPLFVELYERARRKGLTGTDRIFQIDSARAASQIIITATGTLLPISRSATELRHTAAQRLVDAGASQEELAEFMGHSDIDTGLVYYQTSPNQAERVNRALGISAIYQQVAKIAHDRFISHEELSELKGDQQIGGAPHGIPIAGIGGCSSGQPLCPSNPVTACYGCRKFMPISDAEVHKRVLADFRGVVSFFSEASRGDHNSPAYLQLKRTLSSVQSIISEIEEGCQ